jgi:hypothetical protein
MQVIWVGREEGIFFQMGLDHAPKSADAPFPQMPPVSIAKRADTTRPGVHV